jgi:hypothetical protein
MVQRYITDKRMYQAALLKIAMKIRKEKDKTFSEILAEVARDLRLEPKEFRAYVTDNMQSLMTMVKKQVR